MRNREEQELRRTEVLTHGQWREIHFKDLKKGDIFRLFEKTNEPVDNGEISIAMEDAEFSRKVYAVHCEPAGRKKKED